MKRAWPSLLVLLLLPTADAWTSFHGDAQNTGLGPDGHRHDVSVWWEVNLGGFVAADPLATDGLVFVADRGGTVTALDAMTGDVRWEHVMPDAIHGTPAAASGRLFVADAKGTLMALDLQSGAVLAETTVGPTQGDITHHQGKVFLGTEAGDMKALTTDLDLLWTFETAQVGTVSVWDNVTKLTVCNGLLPGKPIRAAPAVADGAVVFGGMDHHVIAVDEHGDPDGTTSIRWLATTGDVVLAAPVVAGDDILIASYDAAVRALSPTTGGDPCFGRMVQAGWSESGARVHATPAWDGERILIARTDGTVEARDADGDPLWSAELDAPITASPIIANGTVMVGDDGGTLTWLDLGNGSVVASMQMAGPIKSAPALLDDATYVVTENGIVSRLAPGFLRLPDLVIESAAAGPDGLNAVIANTGAGDAPSTLLSIQANGTEIDFAIVPALAAGQRANVSAMPDWGDAVEVLLVLDPDDSVREESESNEQAVAVTAATAPAAAGFFGLPLWVWIVAGVASLVGGGGGGFWFWWRRRE